MALYMRARQNGNYEFIFSSPIKQNPRLFASFQQVLRSYETTKLYRDLRLRSAIIQDKQLIMLKNEKVFTRYNGVWNLSAE
jgi:Bardet-Biedl syndrome 5 protein